MKVVLPFVLLLISIGSAVPNNAAAAAESNLSRAHAAAVIASSGEIQQKRLQMCLKSEWKDEAGAAGYLLANRIVGALASQMLRSTACGAMLQERVTTPRVTVTGISELSPAVRQVEFTWAYQSLPDPLRRFALAGGTGTSYLQLFDDGWRVERETIVDGADAYMQNGTVPEPGSLANASWREYQLSDGKISISSTAPFSVQILQIRAATGPIVMKHYATFVGTYPAAVDVYEWPNSVDNLDAMFEHEMAVVAKRTANGRLKEQNRVYRGTGIHSMVGLQSLVVGSSGQFREIMYVIGRTVIGVSVSAPLAKSNWLDTEPFFSSVSCCRL